MDTIVRKGEGEGRGGGGGGGGEGEGGGERGGEGGEEGTYSFQSHKNTSREVTFSVQ